MNGTQFPPNGDLIACARCASCKSRCDRRVPCSQCVAKGHVCQPRYSSRRVRASRRQVWRSQAAATPSNPSLLNANDLAHAENDLFQMQLDELTCGNAGHELPNLLDFSGTALPGDATIVNDNGKFINGSSEYTSENFNSSVDRLAYAISNGHHDPANALTQVDIFPVNPWHLSDSPYQSSQSQNSLSEPLPPQIHDGSGYQEQLREATELPTPSQTSRATQNRGLFTVEHRTSTAVSANPASEDVLGDMAELFVDPGAWFDFGDINTYDNEPLPHSTRDRIVAAVQLLLYRALLNRYASLKRDANAEARFCKGVFGPVVVLPPSHVLVHFIELYGACIDTIQPYLGLAASQRISIDDILQVNMADIGVLLILLIITQGAVLADHPQSLKLADGLTEICRLALNDILENRTIADPMVGGSAIQLLTLCAWNGRESSASFATAKRGQYLSMLRSTGLLDSTLRISEPRCSPENIWEAWKNREEHNRLVYAWVYVDLELSLLSDEPPVLSINSLRAPMPHDTELWHASTFEIWLERCKERGTQIEEDLPSLSGLFRNFLQGRLVKNKKITFGHLRLLLHPLQAMVLEQQQLLRIFDVEESSNGHRILSKVKIEGRLQETQDLLHQMMLLLAQSCSPEERMIPGPTHSMQCASMLMLHLISLNTLTSVPEIERIARVRAPASEIARAETWQRVRYADGERYVLFHAGQIFRLLQELIAYVRLPWGPIAAYRAALSCWSFSFSAKPQTTDDAHISINTMLPENEALDHFLHDHKGIAVFSLPDGSLLPVLDGKNSLTYCISVLEQYPSRLARNALTKLTHFSENWDS